MYITLTAVIYIFSTYVSDDYIFMITLRSYVHNFE